MHERVGCIGKLLFLAPSLLHWWVTLYLVNILFIRSCCLSDLRSGLRLFRYVYVFFVKGMVEK